MAVEVRVGPVRATRTAHGSSIVMEASGPRPGKLWRRSERATICAALHGATGASRSYLIDDKGVTTSDRDIR